VHPGRSLTEGSISRGMLPFALPILYANVLQSLNASVNSIWVGRFLGEAALTATSNANVVMFLLIGLAFGIAMAATILIGQRIGANDIRGAKHAVGTSATFFGGLSVVLAIAGLTLSPALLAAMKTPPQSLPLAIAYMRVIFCALPSLYMYAFVMAVLRAAGDSKTPFYFMLLSVGLDISLNPVFIFGLGPVPRLGIAGSAFATFIAQTISLTAMVHHLYRRRHLLCLHGEELTFLRIDWRLASALLRKGIPMGAQITVMSLSGVLMISLVNRFGVDTTAAFGAALQIWNYIQMPAFAVGQAVSAMAAQNVGAGKWHRINRIATVGVAFSIAITASVILVLELLGVRAFSPFLPAGSPALAVAAHLNRIATPSYMFFAIAMVLFATVRSTGAVMLPLAIMALALLFVRFPLADALLSRYHADAIWWSFTVSSALAAILAALYYKLGAWRSARIVPAGFSADPG
jgi:putative MATE family efflux protein